MCTNVRVNYIKLRRLEGILAVEVREGARLVTESEVPSLLALWVLALMSWVDGNKIRFASGSRTR